MVKSVDGFGEITDKSLLFVFMKTLYTIEFIERLRRERDTERILYRVERQRVTVYLGVLKEQQILPYAFHEVFSHVFGGLSNFLFGLRRTCRKTWLALCILKT